MEYFHRRGAEDAECFYKNYIRGCLGINSKATHDENRNENIKEYTGQRNFNLNLGYSLCPGSVLRL